MAANATTRHPIERCFMSPAIQQPARTLSMLALR
jgi:hypothetical protein